MNSPNALLTVNSSYLSGSSPKTDMKIPVTLTGRTKSVIFKDKEVLHREIICDGRMHWIDAFYISEIKNEDLKIVAEFGTFVVDLTDDYQMRIIEKNLNGENTIANVSFIHDRRMEMWHRKHSNDLLATFIVSALNAFASTSHGNFLWSQFKTHEESTCSDKRTPAIESISRLLQEHAENLLDDDGPDLDACHKAAAEIYSKLNS